jgi:hypothetical protein
MRSAMVLEDPLEHGVGGRFVPIREGMGGCVHRDLSGAAAWVHRDPRSGRDACAPAGVPSLNQGDWHASWEPGGHARCQVMAPPVQHGFHAPAGVQREAKGFHRAAGESDATVS